MKRVARGISRSIEEDVGIDLAGWIPDYVVLGFKNPAHVAPNIVAAAHADDWRLFFGTALDYSEDELDLRGVLDGIMECALRVVQALVGAGFFDPAKQLAIPNRFSIGVSLHSSKRKLALTREAAWKLSLRAEAARGCLDG